MTQSILIVEDEADLNYLYERIMRYSSPQIDFAVTLEEAMVLLRAKEYDIVVTDLRLTNGDRSEGIEIIEYISQTSPHCPIVLTTVRSALPPAKHVLHLPNLHTLLKPFERDEFKQTLLQLGIAVDDQRPADATDVP